jgi:hypothetical protein
MRISVLVTVATLVVARDSLRAQSVSVMAQAIPLVTRADPTATRSALTEGYLSQPVVMAHASWSALRAVATLDFEGLTLDRGELSTGASGEGYVDRRHPHAYVHELLAGAETQRKSWGASLFAGRGFAPFGSDDPMMRPFEKYPTNHHLAQILERAVVVGALRAGPAIAEFGTFDGDETAGPATAPNYSRFGDSWSSRLTLVPLANTELSASLANVKSPEVRVGHGLDQRKTSVVARYSRDALDSWRYAFLEWARTTDRDRGAPVTTFTSWLGEAALCRSGVVVSGRVERTDRPEEEQLTDPFRSPRPPADLSNLGVSRWTTLTASLSSPRLGTSFASARPFVEVEHLSAAPGNPPGLFDPRLRYGARTMWMLSVGIRLRAGEMHDRMGRYGAAVPLAPQMNSANSNAMPGMPDMPGMSHEAQSGRPGMSMTHLADTRCRL